VLQLQGSCVAVAAVFVAVLAVVAAVAAVIVTVVAVVVAVAAVIVAVATVVEADAAFVVAVPLNEGFKHYFLNDKGALWCLYPILHARS